VFPVHILIPKGIFLDVVLFDEHDCLPVARSPDFSSQLCIETAEGTAARKMIVILSLLRGYCYIVTD
jgi:hypothetical protein